MADGRNIRFRQTAGARPAIEAIGRDATPWEDAFHFTLTLPWVPFFAMVAGAFLALNAFFATLFWLWPGDVANSDGSWPSSFFFSVQTLATIGYGAMYPNDTFAHVVVTVEALVGILFTALVTGMTYAKFARPTAKVLFTERVVITPRDGVPTLMMRMANWRHNQITEAQLRVSLLVTERTREGDVMRRPLELPLVRDRNAVFMLSWTAMHVIDERSPFHGPDALERLRREGAELYLTLTGLDATMGQTIHASYRYTMDDVVPNARYADVLVPGANGKRVIDYSRFHDVEPAQTAQG